MDRLTSRFALQSRVILIVSWVGNWLCSLDCGTYTRWCPDRLYLSSGGTTRAEHQSVPAFVWAAKGLQGASGLLQQPGTVVECGVASLAPLSPLPLLCSTLLLWALQRQPQGGKGRGERAAAPLIFAKLSGCLPLALCYASTASLAAWSYSSLVHTDTAGVDLPVMCLS